MKIHEARYLSWGTKLKPNEKQRKAFHENHNFSNAIFLGISRKYPDLIVIIREGMQSSEKWHPSFWEIDV